MILHPGMDDRRRSLRAALVERLVERIRLHDVGAARQLFIDFVRRGERLSREIEAAYLNLLKGGMN